MKYIAVTLSMICFLNVNAQFDHIDVLKGLDGNALFEKLVVDYKPTFTMTYGMARDTLYSKIDVLPGNKLSGIYSGFQITLDPNEDPTQDAFAKGINAEHTYPQSKGASDGFARSDMHHLRPSKIEVNSARGSFPYAESPDSQTDVWFRGGQQSSNIPTSNIDQYSELNNSSGGVFEPREDIKGDIARGIFYFYTMYRSEAMNADASFFDLQKDILCEWHFADPVDEREWLRNEQIAVYQDGKVNPFIYDCSLVSRLYCDQISDECTVLTPVVDIDYIDKPNLSFPKPNPTHGTTTLTLFSPVKDLYSIVVYSVEGEIILSKKLNLGTETTKSVVIDLLDRKGIFFVSVNNRSGYREFRKIVKI